MPRNIKKNGTKCKKKIVTKIGFFEQNVYVAYPSEILVHSRAYNITAFSHLVQNQEHHYKI